MKFTLAILILVVFIPDLHSRLSEPKLSFAKNLLFYLRNKSEDVLEKAGGNTQCVSDLKGLIHDAVLRKRWALEMLDASGKLPSGILAGNINMVGNFDQCINIREVREDNTIDGQYCTVVLLPSAHFTSDFSFLFDSVALTQYLGFNLSYQSTHLLKMVKMSYGLCMPKSCSIGNLQRLWDYVEHSFGVPVHIHFIDSLCNSKDKPIESYSIDKYVYAGFGIYICILLASAWYDLMIYQYLEDKEKCNNKWIVFSLYTNFKKLFSYSTNSNREEYLKCISGIKVISMLWIVFGHRILLNVFSRAVNSLYILEWKQNGENTVIFAASFAVDTFLFLSGFLLSYGYLKYKSTWNTEKSFSFKIFYSIRLLRLWPALLAAIFFYMSVFKRLSDGPAWSVVSKKLAGSCRYAWWGTTFFINNYLNPNIQCIEQTWYLAVDTQLYVISPLILLNLQKKPWKTCAICLGACIVSGIYIFVITIDNNYGAIYAEADHDYLRYIYYPTYVRMAPWLIGIVLGYLTFSYHQISIPERANLFLWCFSLGVMLYLILIHAVFMKTSYDPLRSALFNSCARPAWSLALGFIIFSCASGNGGIVNQFLSLPIFQVLVRLSYSVYIVHLGVLLYFVAGKKVPGYFSNIGGVHDFMGDLFFVFATAVVWCLFFESPFIALSKTIVNKVMESQLIESNAGRKKKMKSNYVVCVYSFEKGSKRCATKKMK